MQFIATKEGEFNTKVYISVDKIICFRTHSNDEGRTKIWLMDGDAAISDETPKDFAQKLLDVHILPEELRQSLNEQMERT